MIIQLRIKIDKICYTGAMYKNELLTSLTSKKSYKKQNKDIIKKAGEYYLKNKEAIKEKSKNWYKNLPQEEKEKIKEYQGKKYRELVQYKKEALQNKIFLLFFLV